MRDRELKEAAEADGLSALIDIIGFEATMQVHQRYAGSTVFIPEHPGPDHPLATLVGEDCLKQIAFYFGGAGLSVPLGRNIQRLRRQREIDRLRRKGCNISQIARALDMSSRGVRGIMADSRAGRGQRGRIARPRRLCGFTVWQIKFLSRVFDKPEKFIRAAVAPHTLKPRPYDPEQRTFPFLTDDNPPPDS